MRNLNIQDLSQQLAERVLTRSKVVGLKIVCLSSIVKTHLCY